MFYLSFYEENGSEDTGSFLEEDADFRFIFTVL